MNDDILNTIEVLTKKVGAKEEEANKLKKLVNELCTEAGISPRYLNISESGSSIAAIRSDQFYGQTLTAAIRNYLEQRKAANLGAAAVQEIYQAIKEGGYKFDTKNETNARTGVGNALRKTSSIFHRLPNGQFGLLIWYPSAKAKPESAELTTRKQDSNAEGKDNASFVRYNGDLVSNKEIRDVILGYLGEFQSSDIENAIKSKYPSKSLPKTKIPSVIFILKGKGLLKEVSARSGAKGAIYTKA